MIVAEVLLATLTVVTVNVAVLPPAGTVTLDEDSVADGLELVSVTVVPPEGAGPFRVTVPLDELPPVRELGLSETPCSRGSTVKEALPFNPP